MSIRGETLHTLDYSDVSTGRRLASVHPGGVLLKDALAFVQSGRELGVPVAIEVSRSGNGAHGGTKAT